MTDSTTSAELHGQGEYCPSFQHAVELIGRRWTGSILKVLTTRPLRFGEIRAQIPGLSDRLLDARLTELETERVVTRTEDCSGVRYALSDKGLALEPVFAAIAAWSHEHNDRDLEPMPGRRRS